MRADMRRLIWVNVGAVKNLTGWDRAAMQAARLNGYIEYKEQVNEDGTTSTLYNLTSLNDKFIIKLRNEKKIVI